MLLLPIVIADYYLVDPALIVVSKNDKNFKKGIDVKK